MALSSNPMAAPKTEWMILAAGLVLAVPLWMWRGELPRAGAQREVALTLVTSDREDLSCALDGTYGGFGCGYESNGKAVDPAQSAEQTLSPYMTEARQLFLIPGLFLQPALGARYESESPQGVRRSRLKRFTAVCKVRLVQKVENVRVRWLQQGDFGNGGPAWIAQAENCTVK
jgi:hypothetical protein